MVDAAGAPGDQAGIPPAHLRPPDRGRGPTEGLPGLPPGTVRRAVCVAHQTGRLPEAGRGGLPVPRREKRWRPEAAQGADGGGR